MVPGTGLTAPLVLASASPRRRELLTLLGLEFEVRAAEIEELRSGDPERIVVENAVAKAGAVAAVAEPGSVVLGVDTDVALDGAVLGKPEGPDGARERLRRLSGRAHRVLGGIALIAPDGGVQSELAVTTVELRALGEREVDAYVASGEWRDRAGAYAVQGLGAALIRRIDGDLSNVIGLPIPLLCRMIGNLQER